TTGLIDFKQENRSWRPDPNVQTHQRHQRSELGEPPPVPASSLSGDIRGHARRLSGQASTKCLQWANTFTNGKVNEWKTLPATMTDADSVNKFKDGYDAFHLLFSMCYVQGVTIGDQCYGSSLHIKFYVQGATIMTN
ncbi:hypothetical protein BpHYR1_005503, partial [Brachionus plicatilis]